MGWTSASNPNSDSVVRSGLSALLPSPPLVMPGTSVLLITTGVGLKNCSASVGPGCSPDAPYAPRTFSEPSHAGAGKNGSSDTTHEPESLGYRMFPKRRPNDVLSSLRNAPVTKRRFLKPRRSSTNRPSVTVSSVCSLAVGMTPPASEFVPAVSVWTLARPPRLRWWQYGQPPL